MDPLAALQAEIKKRKSEQAATSKHQPATKRWRSQADIERDRERNYLQKQREAEQQRLLRKQKQLELSSNPTTTVSTNPSAASPQRTTAKPSESHHPNNDESTTEIRDRERDRDTERTSSPPLSRNDVIRRLRALKHPATKFGEDDWARFKRLREIQISIDDQPDGQDNVYQKKMREVLAKDDAEDRIDFDASGSGSILPSLSNDNDNNKKNSTISMLDVRDGVKRKHGADVSLNNENSASDTTGIPSVSPSVNKSATENTTTATSKEDFVYNSIQRYMRLWNDELDALTKEERRSNKGRSHLATYEQTKEWLKPLFKLLRKRKLSRPILDALRDIFHAAAQREYMQAMRLYLERLAIGNAPWPMGATQVGIHSRAAREKIGEDKIAHVMNDEQTRKFIQAVKRLLTVAQRHFPTDASKSAST